MGHAADLVVFDLDGITDNSSFAEPTIYADGIHAVAVNGALAFADGQRMPEHAGCVFQRSSLPINQVRGSRSVVSYTTR